MRNRTKSKQYIFYTQIWLGEKRFYTRGTYINKDIKGFPDWLKSQSFIVIG